MGLPRMVQPNSRGLLEFIYPVSSTLKKCLFSQPRFPENFWFLSDTWLFCLSFYYIKHSFNKFLFCSSEPVLVSIAGNQSAYRMKERRLGMFGTSLSVQRNLHLILCKQNSLMQKEAALGRKRKNKTKLDVKKFNLCKAPREMGWDYGM